MPTQKEEGMAPKIVQAGRHFINVSNLLWARRNPSTDPGVTTNQIDLIFVSPEKMLSLFDEEAVEMICLLELIAKIESDKP